MAPEVIRNEAYDASADVYSFGLLLHAVSCGVDYPYADQYLTAVQAAMGVARNDLRPRISPAVDKGVRDVITECWKGEAKERPRMSEVVELLVEAKNMLGRKKQEGTGVGAALYNYFYG